MATVYLQKQNINLEMVKRHGVVYPQYAKIHSTFRLKICPTTKIGLWRDPTLCPYEWRKQKNSQTRR
ncbi:MAG: thermonuclease family protein [Haemophilus parainfluenzae]